MYYNYVYMCSSCLINLREMAAHLLSECQIPRVLHQVTYASAVQTPTKSCIDIGMH